MRHLCIDSFGLRQRKHQRVRSQCSHGGAPVAFPSGLSGGPLVLCQHLDQAPDRWRQGRLGHWLETVPIHTTRQLDNNFFVEASRGPACIEQVNGKHFASVVEKGVHGVEGQFQLVDAASGASRVELWLV